ncbi:MAG: hypothetical protein R6X03_01205 [Methyloceanibacter sp.]
MENQQPSPFGTQSTSTETQADREWSAFERDLDMLGRQLSELQVDSAALGSHLISAVQARFEDVKARAAAFRRAREGEVEELRRTAATQTERAFSEARARSTEAARQVWERAEPLRQGAKDVGEGLLRAWGEVRASFGKAAGRLQTESKAADEPTPATFEQRRDL